LATADFGAGTAVPRVNAWVNQKTKGKISQIVDAFSPLTAPGRGERDLFQGSLDEDF